MIAMKRVVGAELLKVGTVRSYQISVALGAAAVAAMAAAMAMIAGRDSSLWTPQPVALPMEYFAYVMMILGVLVVTADASSGAAAVMASLVPDRWRVDLSKYTAMAIVALLAGALAAILVFVADWIGLGIGFGSITTREAVEVNLAGLAAVPLLAILGVAFGILVRSTSAAISLLLLWSFLVETVLVFTIPEEYAAYLPFKTIGGSRAVLDELGPGSGLLVLSGYVVLLVAVAAFLQRRRDSVVP